jgi:hypothetical protein
VSGLIKIAISFLFLRHYCPESGSLYLAIRSSPDKCFECVSEEIGARGYTVAR